jgi:hypothetical protein
MGHPGRSSSREIGCYPWGTWHRLMFELVTAPLKQKKLEWATRAARLAPFNLSLVTGHDLVDYFSNHLGIGEAGFFCGHREFLSTGEPGIGIRFDDVNFAFAG